MVYLIDIGNKSVFRTRQAIMDEIHAAPALKLLCQKKILGRLQIWRRCPDAEISCYSLVRELSPVWNHELVTPETVHVCKLRALTGQVSQAKFSQDYVTDVIRQSDVAEPDSRRPPWRIHLIPLAFDPLAEEDCSTCCLVAQCHELLTSVVDNLIQRALKIHRMDFGSSLPTSHHYRVLTVSVERSIPSGSHAPAVSWTKAIPRTDFIDRVCSLAGTTIRELFIVSFSQSLNQCYNQSGMLRSDSVVKLIKGREESSIYFVWKA